MAGTIRSTANDILNQVGVEVGLAPVNDPFASTDDSYRQLRYLINTAGEELSQLYPWQFLRRVADIPIEDGVSEYDLPDDFLYLVNQTFWDHGNDNPVYGPLSAQQWTALEAGEILVGSDYYYFRLTQDQIHFYPETVTTALDARYEYVSRNWVEDSTNPGVKIDSIKTGSDTPLFNRTLLGRMLKVKFLEAKGFDTSKAQADLNQAYELMVARNKSAPVLNAGRSRRGSFYINTCRNTPETGYGG